MRVAIMLIVGICFPAAGCSTLVISSGTQLKEVRTREEVQATFGSPVNSGLTDGEAFEEFQTRHKIAEPNKAIYLCMGDVVTLGFGELLWFPRESFIAARRSIRGQKLRFTYDEGGNVKEVLHDGERVIGGPGSPSALAKMAEQPQKDGGH